VGAVRPSSLSYEIITTGKSIPIKEFPVGLTLRGVDPQTWRVEHLFQRSFGIKAKASRAFGAAWSVPSSDPQTVRTVASQGTHPRHRAERFRPLDRAVGGTRHCKNSSDEY
jgi:hypothetical protein